MSGDDDVAPPEEAVANEDLFGDGEGEGDDEDPVDPLDRRRAHLERLRQARVALAARHRGEREDPFAVVPVGYLIELFGSPRFASLDAAARHAVLLHAVEHHHRHLLENSGAVTGSPPPYLRRRREREHVGRGTGTSRFDVAPLPQFGAAPHRPAAAGS